MKEQITLRCFRSHDERIYGLIAVKKYLEDGHEKKGKRSGCLYQFEDGLSVYVYRTLANNIGAQRVEKVANSFGLGKSINA